jgi:hypothetical protein
VQHRSARDQQRQAWGAREQVGKARCCRPEVLGVVEYEQKFAFVKGSRECLGRFFSCDFLDFERARNRFDQEVRST